MKFSRLQCIFPLLENLSRYLRFVEISFLNFNFTLIQEIVSVASLRMYETCYLIYLLILEQFKF